MPAGQVAVVSGPNLAMEIAKEQPTATVIACADHERAVELQRASFTGYFRPYTNEDVVGCELGGACKNVIALACGMASGLGYGANTIASLITRGLAETARLGAALGADPLTFAGLAGLGDLVATCSSPLSRNRTFGARLGAGESLAQAQEAAHGQVAEGVKSCSSIRELAARAGVEMPITEAGAPGLPRRRRPARDGRRAAGPGAQGRAGMSGGGDERDWGDGTLCGRAGLPEPVAGQPFLPPSGVRGAVPPRGRQAVVTYGGVGQPDLAHAGGRARRTGRRRVRAVPGRHGRDRHRAARPVPARATP